MMLFSAEPVRKYFTGRSVPVRRYVQVKLRLINYQVLVIVNSNYLAHGQIILAFEDISGLVKGWSDACPVAMH